MIHTVGRSIWLWDPGQNVKIDTRGNYKNGRFLVREQINLISSINRNQFSDDIAQRYRVLREKISKNYNSEQHFDNLIIRQSTVKLKPQFSVNHQCIWSVWKDRKGLSKCMNMCQISQREFRTRNLCVRYLGCADWRTVSYSGIQYSINGIVRIIICPLSTHDIRNVCNNKVYIFLIIACTCLCRMYGTHPSFVFVRVLRACT